MKTQRGREWVQVLSVGPIEKDHRDLEYIFTHLSGAALCPNCEWRLNASYTLEDAVAAVRRRRISVVLCERDLPRGTWKEMLVNLRLMRNPPYLIVTSRVADEDLWAEALNLGAHDVIAKPFDDAEVIRSVSLAWLRWKEQRGAPPQSMACVA